MKFSRVKSMEWVPSEDMDTIAKLCRSMNQDRRYEIFWEYHDLTSAILLERKALGWLYYENNRLSGFALGRLKRATLRFDKAFVLEEVWAPCDGTRSELGNIGSKDRERIRAFRSFAESLHNFQTVILRSADDNQFSHMIARVLKTRWINGLIIAERKLSGEFEPTLPLEYRLRMFGSGDEFHLSEIHKEAFNEVVSTEDYRKWATSPNCRCLVAALQGKPVGFTIAERRKCSSLGDFIVAVLPEHQSKHVGSALLKAGLNSLVQMGVRKVVADYLMLNTPAHNLYKKHGFKIRRIYNYFLLSNVIAPNAVSLGPRSKKGG